MKEINGRREYKHKNNSTLPQVYEQVMQASVGIANRSRRQIDMVIFVKPKIAADPHDSGNPSRLHSSLEVCSQCEL
jgi:hypothetical protein